jgi:hypothetical protein
VCAFKGWIQRRVGAQFRNQVQLDLPDHKRAGIIAKMSVQGHIFQGEHVANRFQKVFEGLLETHQFRVEDHLWLAFVLAPLGAARLFVGAGLFDLFRGSFGLTGALFGRGFDSLGRLEGIRALFPDIDQGKSKKRQARNDLFLQAREKTIQAIRFCAGFTDDNFITRDNMFVCRLQKACPKKQPVQGMPGQNRLI